MADSLPSRAILLKDFNGVNVHIDPETGRFYARFDKGTGSTLYSSLDLSGLQADIFKSVVKPVLNVKAPVTVLKDVPEAKQVQAEFIRPYGRNSEPRFGVSGRIDPSATVTYKGVAVEGGVRSGGRAARYDSATPKAVLITEDGRHEGMHGERTVIDPPLIEEWNALCDELEAVYLTYVERFKALEARFKTVTANDIARMLREGEGA